MILRSLCFAGVVAVLLSGCGGGGTVKSCPAPETSCDGFCAKLDSDTANCGACGNHCAAQQTCNSGVCTNCPTGELPCSGACIDVQNDRNNCGGCGIACGANESCDRGACVATGLTNCGVSNGTVSAKDLNADPESCGRCGNACPANHLCTAGVCTPSCTGTGRLCEADPSGTGAPTLICIDTASDPDHCGGCSVRCGPNQTCTLGTCTNCPAGQLQCAGATAGTTACRPVLSDNDNCGGCGIACGQGSSCDNGVCVSSNLTNCGALSDGGVGAFDLQNDPQNCGACGNACGAREVCRAGSCTFCASRSCGNRCVDTASDQNNCGGCGTACAGNTACIAGSCVAPISIKLMPPVSTGSVAPSTSYSASIEVTSAYPITYARVDLAGVGPSQLFSGPSAFLNGYYVSTWQSSSLVSGAAGTTQSLTFVVRDSLYQADAGTNAVHEAQLAATVLARTVPSIAPTLSIQQSDGGTLSSGSFVGLTAPPLTLIATTTDVNTTAVEFRAGGYPVATAPVNGGAATLTTPVAALTSIDQQLTACAVNPAGTGTCSGGVTLNAGNTPVVTTAGYTHALTIDSQTNEVWSWYLSGGQVRGMRTDYVGATEPTPIPLASGVLQIYSPDGNILFAISNNAVWSVSCAGGSCSTTQVVSSGSWTFTGMAAASSHALIFTTTAGAIVGVSIDSGSVGAVPTLLGWQLLGGLFTPQSQKNGALVCATASAATGGTYTIWLLHPALPTGRQALAQNANTLVSMVVKRTGELVWQYRDPAGNTYAQAGLFDGTALTKTPVLSVGASPINVPTLVRPGQIFVVLQEPSGTGFQWVDFDVNTQSSKVPVLYAAGGNPVLSVLRGREGISAPLIISDDQLKAVMLTQASGGMSTIWLVDLVTGSASAVRTATGINAPAFVHSAAGLRASGENAPNGAVSAVPAIYWTESIAGSNPPTANVYYQRYGAGPSPLGSPVQVDRLALVNQGPMDELFASGTSGQLFFQTPNGGRADLVAVKLDGTPTTDLVAQDVTGFIGKELAGAIVVGQADGRLSIGKLSATVPLSSGLLTTVSHDLAGLPARTPQGIAAPPFGVLPDLRQAFAVTNATYLPLIGGAVGVLSVIDLDTGTALNGGEVTYAIGNPVGVGAIGSSALAMDHNGSALSLMETGLTTGNRRDLTAQTISALSLTTPLNCPDVRAGPALQYCIAGGSGFLLRDGVQTQVIRGAGNFSDWSVTDRATQELDYGIVGSYLPTPSIYQLDFQSSASPLLIAANLANAGAFGGPRSADNTVLAMQVLTGSGLHFATKLPLSGHAIPPQQLP